MLSPPESYLPSMQATKRGLVVDALGGGRIEHHPETGLCHIYGYSSGFGAAPHQCAAALVKKWHPLYAEGVTVSYEGY
jgi:hypothetical protein